MHLDTYLPRQTGGILDTTKGYGESINEGGYSFWNFHIEGKLMGWIIERNGTDNVLYIHTISYFTYAGGNAKAGEGFPTGRCPVRVK